MKQPWQRIDLSRQGCTATAEILKRYNRYLKPASDAVIRRCAAFANAHMQLLDA